LSDNPNLTITDATLFQKPLQTVYANQRTSAPFSQIGSPVLTQIHFTSSHLEDVDLSRMPEIQDWTFSGTLQDLYDEIPALPSHRTFAHLPIGPSRTLA
jgi:hypothetical protein